MFQISVKRANLFNIIYSVFVQYCIAKNANIDPPVVQRFKRDFVCRLQVKKSVVQPLSSIFYFSSKDDGKGQYCIQYNISFSFPVETAEFSRKKNYVCHLWKKLRDSNNMIFLIPGVLVTVFSLISILGNLIR